MKIFGIELFKVKKSNTLHETELDRINKSEFLPDFFPTQGNTHSDNLTEMLYAVTESDLLTTADKISKNKKKQKKVVKPKGRPPTQFHVTPKGVYEMKMLHDETFKLKLDPEYVEKQIEDFKNRLTLIKTEEYDMRRGLVEVQSVLIRLENRKKYSEHNNFFEQYPYTTTSRINAVIRANDYLKIGQIAQFVADLPKEAIDTMKEYDRVTKEICGKKAVYYILADKKDFEKTEKRRDPILFAQSPFGHFWQILGAWDREMLLLEDL